MSNEIAAVTAVAASTDAANAALPALNRTYFRATAWRGHFRRKSVLPGFGVTLGITLLYLGLIVLVPLSATYLKSIQLGWDVLWQAISAPRVVAAYRVSLTTALAAAIINVFAGLLVAWVLVRYRFPGRRLLDALVDLPFALPTAVAGIALTALWAPKGWLGQALAIGGIKVAFTPLGIVLALTFVSLPFVVRTVQPVLENLESGFEEAAATLGATRAQIFWRVLLPALTPALLTGFALAFARGLGEYGSVIFIAGNLPMVSEIVPLIIVVKLEQYDYVGATAIAAAMLTMSFVLLLTINVLQAWSRRAESAR